MSNTITSITNKHYQQLLAYIVPQHPQTHVLVNGSTLINHIIHTSYHKLHIQWNIIHLYTEFKRNYNIPDHWPIVEHTELSTHLYNKLSTHKQPQPITALFQLQYNNINSNSLQLLDSNCHTLILDNIKNPSNLGSLIRSAVSFNYLQIICIDCCNIYNMSVINTSMGAIVNCNVIQCTHTEFINYAKSNNINHLVAMTPHSDTTIQQYIQSNQLLHHTNKQYKSMNWLIIGNETNGISNNILKLCSYKVRVDINSDVMNSLNATVAGSIAMYLLQ